MLYIFYSVEGKILLVEWSLRQDKWKDRWLKLLMRNLMLMGLQSGEKHREVKSRVGRVRKERFFCCHGEILELECKQIMMNKGKDGWEMQGRMKAYGGSLQQDLHPILVKRRCVEILEVKIELYFVCSIHSFKWNLMWVRGRVQMPVTWKPLKIML